MYPSSEGTHLYPYRHSAWHQVGTSVTGHRGAMSALEAARLTGWNIRKLAQIGVEETPDGPRRIGNPDQVMLARTDPRTGATRYLSSVGVGYGVRQNEDQAALLDALVAESGAGGFAHAGAIDEGRRTFVTMKLPDALSVAGLDPVELYLVVFNSHDGSAAFRVSLVPFRVLCANQLPMVIRDQVASVAIRHTRNATIDVAEIRSKLRLMYGYAEAFEQQAGRMIEAELSTEEFREVVEVLWPVNDATAPPRTRFNADRRRHQLMRLWTDAGTQHNIRGTRWAGLQAITEYLDHYEPARDANTRALRVLTGSGVLKRKQEAFDLLSV
ncbi:DUF932 domain-containing protein [Saccharothrix variisporea]|uniref:Phage/plasmid-like protein (TIGR03299 family) n=1 Tax=Saccharothrix variisporea TaxID=543527 RepID=A0A495X9T2_9PSEU|nr:DUF932 domain-containing protein [Saccharothrix variisporea]RKT69373.1 phage/plasmid-like protein (TIGR03299 family) [Saccharothrix variisporea]